MDEKVKLCSNCGQKADTEATFCVHCGHAIAGENTDNTPKPKFCTGCGSEIPDDAAFCVKCGLQAGKTPQIQEVMPKQPSNSVTKNTGGLLKKIGIGAVAVAILIFLFNAFGGADYTMSANQLASEYSKDTVAADKKYKGKTIEISGKIYHKGQFNNSSDLFVQLYNSNQRDNIEVLIAIPLSEKDKINVLKDGDIITATGSLVGLVPQEDKKKRSIQIQADKVK